MKSQYRIKTNINVVRCFIFIFFNICVLEVVFGVLKAENGIFDIGVCSSINKVELLRQTGYSYVEVGIQDFFCPNKSDTEFAKVYKKAMRSPIPIKAANSFFPSDMKLVGPDLNMQKVLNYVDIVMRRAQQVGTNILVLGSGGARRIPDNYDREKAKQQFVSLCRAIAGIGLKYDVVVVLEPLRKQETNFVNTVKEGLDIVLSVNHPHFKLLADFYHMACEKESPSIILEAGSELYHCHIAEKNRRTAPGVEGDDFVPYFKALKQIGYRGCISLECNWGDFEKEIVMAIREIDEQVSFTSK